jgi:hypothetical protein
MKIFYLLPVIIFSFLFSACTSSKESSGVWVNKEKFRDKTFKKMFIVAMTADVEARTTVETDLAAAAVARGYQAVKSVDVLPPELSNPKMPTKDELVSKVKESGCDAVLIASLLKKEESVYYEPGHTTYAILPYYTYYSGYYSNWYPAVSTSDYYAHEKTYFMLSNFYDAASEEIVISVQSKVFEPSSLRLFSKTYTYNMVKQLDKANIRKKK